MSLKIFTPINDDRFFMGGLDNSILQDIPTYEVDEYRLMYPIIQLRLAHKFSINMQEEITEFITSVSPLLQVDVPAVIDLICFYYNDIDPVISVADEFVDNQKVEEIFNTLVQLHYDTETAQQLLEAQIAVLTDAMRPFIEVITGVLSRVGVPAIYNYGSCYRLSNIDSVYNVFFTIRHPDNVDEELNG